MASESSALLRHLDDSELEEGKEVESDEERSPPWRSLTAAVSLLLLGLVAVTPLPSAEPGRARFSSLGASRMTRKRSG